MTWSCYRCTLVNSDVVKICSACGSEKQVFNTGVLPKIIEKQVNNIASAVIDIFNMKSAPRPHVVYQKTYDINNLPSPSSLPVPPRPPAPSVLRASLAASSLNSSATTSSESGSARRQIDENVNAEFATASLTIKDREKNDEKEAQTIFETIVNTCKALNEPFIDPDFPHSNASLGEFWRQSDVVNGTIASHEKLVWLRPSQIYTKDGRRWPWAVFRDPVSSDIEQGTLGDCWLLSALAIVAERPDILEQVVLTKTYNHTGVYQIRLCVDGAWRIITIDDFFPCRSGSGSLAFATGRKNQLWVPLIEKALAKALGSYALLRSGRTITGLSILTGAACEMISLEQSGLCLDTVWAQLLSANEAGFIMGCSCGAGSREANEEAYKAKGLLSKHAYSVLDVRQEGEHRLLRLRNPWGSFVWQGAWSDDWQGWPTELRARLIAAPRSASGTFWINFADFQQHFDAIEIARIRTHHGWSELRMPVKLGGSFSNDRALRLIVETNTNFNATLHQANSRTLLDKIDIMICVHVVTADGSVGEVVARSIRRMESFVSTGEQFLPPGHYIVFAHSLGTIGVNGLKHDGTLVVHSNHKLFGEQVAASPDMFTDSLFALVQKYGKIHASMKDCIPRYMQSEFGGLIIVVENHSDHLLLLVELNCQKSTNVISSRGTLHVSDYIPPLHRQIVIILSNFEPSQSYLVQHSMNVSFHHRLQPSHSVHKPGFENQDTMYLHDCKPLCC